MNNMPAKQDNKSKAVGQPQAQWGARELDADNFLLSKVLPMQLTSPLVKEDKAKFGEFRDNVTGELLAPVGKALLFVPIDLKENWIVSELEGKKWVFKETFPYTRSNSQLAKEETVNDVQIKRVHTMDYYVLLMDDLKKGIDIPKVISFRVTSLRGGKVLYTQMYALNPRQGLSPAGMVMAATNRKVDGKDGTYVVMDVTPIEKAHTDYVDAAKKWYDKIVAGQTKVDETEVV